MLIIPDTTLVVIDCVEVHRVQKAINQCLEGVRFSDIKFLTSLETDSPYKYWIPAIQSKQDYTLFCLNNLYRFIDTPYMMVAQYDGYVLRPDLWTPEFMAYDYIGSVLTIDGKQVVGNGGFSIRSRRLMEYVSAMYRARPPRIHFDEDSYICYERKKELEDSGFTFAPVSVAEKFSNEHDIALINKTFGFHGSYILRKGGEI